MALQLLTSSIFNFSNYTGRVLGFSLTTKLLSSFTLSLFISCVAFAQSGELNLPPDKKYEEA
ncbi:MAG: hypothetical protein LC664_07225, partial [Flavobacteriales bacterium]|nr:hypothetical protein [Flavobacteriales bacterium]